MVQRRARGRPQLRHGMSGPVCGRPAGPVLGHRRLRRGRILERMGAFWLSLQPEAVQGLTEMQQFADRFVTFMEVNVSFDRDDILTSVLMGKSCW